MSNTISTTTMINASLEDASEFVNYHLNLGVDHMYLFFDNPEDKVIEFFKGNKKVSCIKCNSKHWAKLSSRPNLTIVDMLNLNSSRGFKLAKKDGYEWVINIDADELIYTEENLKLFLSKIKKDVDVIRLRSLEAIRGKHQDASLFRGVNSFKTFGYVSKFYYSHKRLLQKLVPFIRRNEGSLSNIYFNGHPTGKSIVRTSAKINQMGIHEPIPKRNVKLKQILVSNAHLLHFFCCNFDSWKSKWVAKSTVDPSELVKMEILLLNKFLDARKKNDSMALQKLFERQSFMSPMKRFVLGLLGFVKVVGVDKRMFDRGINTN